MATIYRRGKPPLVFALIALTLALLSCNLESEPAPTTPDDPVARALDVAQSFVDGYYRDFTDQAYDSGYTDLDTSRLVDHSSGARAFHDRVIEDGTVTLGMLQKKIERWVEEQC